jgi:hypothetical protein
MKLNLYEILQKVLNESVGSKNVVDVINKRQYVVIAYSDSDNNAPGKRLIQPYDYGLTLAGNEALRAYQVSGDSLRGEPGWKMFLLSGINYWEPRQQTFNVPPPMQGYDAPEYNEKGDNSMKVIYAQVKFDYDTNDTLSVQKAKTQTLKNAPKIAKKNTQGPIPNASQQYKKNVFTSQPNSQKYAQHAKNINDTANDFDRFDNDIWAKAEAEKQQQDNAMMQNSVMKPQQTQQGPIAPDKNNDKDKKLKK